MDNSKQRKMKIVILDSYTAVRKDLDWSALEALGEVVAYDNTPAALTVERCKDAEAVLTNKVLLTADVLAQLPQLKYIGILATGVNSVDCAEATRRGIVVTNIPAYSTMSVAQLAISFLLNATSRVDHYAVQNRAGKWNIQPHYTYWDYPFTELAGKQMAIVGFGNIGAAVARIAQALGMKVVAVTSKTQEQLPAGVIKLGLDEALSTSFAVSLHCPLTPGTRHLLNEITIGLLRPDAIVINTARGPLVDDAAMADALAKGKLAAYCTDVLAQEPPVGGNPVLDQPNAFVTPHMGWTSFEARTRLIATAAANLRAFVKGNPQNVIKL